MFQIKILACNILLWLSFLPESVRYICALIFPKLAQKRVLKSILTKAGLSESNFKSHPISTYKDNTSTIDRIRLDGQHPAYFEKVIRLCPTSGSSSDNKLIPYTPSLKKAFQKGLYPWMFFLYLKFPILFLKRQYWSVTPLFENGAAWPDSKVKIGFENDEDYVGNIQRLITKNVWIDTKEIAKDSNDMETFIAKLADRLESEKFLGLISVWSPSLLSLLLRRNPDSLRKDLVISAWAHGFSKTESSNIARQLDIKLQPKGLLSTEACITIPVGTRTFFLSYNSHYFEFREVNNDIIYTPDLLLVGHDYEVIVTTQSGFIRYATGDIIRVTKLVFGRPSFEFIGRTGVIDLFGEKLDEVSTSRLIEEVLGFHGIDHSFWFLAPTTKDNDVAYTLFIKSNITIPSNLAFGIETSLRQIYHYDLCRSIGQLAHSRIFAIANESPMEVFVQRSIINRTVRIGDVKIPRIHSGFDWEKVYDGEFT